MIKAKHDCFANQEKITGPSAMINELKKNTVAWGSGAFKRDIPLGFVIVKLKIVVEFKENYSFL